MTGRDFIQYILRYRLEDEEIFRDLINNEERLKSMLCLISLDEAALKFNVGESTIRSWIGLGWVSSVEINNNTYISFYQEDPRQSRGGGNK